MPKKNTISPGQGLLILIDHYKSDPVHVDELKKLYLSGAQNKSDLKKIKIALTDVVLSNYMISYEIDIIDNDPTRRYFETQLAYETLKNVLPEIRRTGLKSQLQQLMMITPAYKLSSILPVLHGELRVGDPDLEKEYSDYTSRIVKGNIFGKLPLVDKEKILLLIKISFLGVIIAREYSDLPLNIYGKGIFSTANRGKILARNRILTRNQHYGLMKGHMPLPQDDLAHSELAIPYLKASDQATFNKEASWVKSNFKKLVHPFSNSISGTVLSQLRMCAQFRNEGATLFTESAEKMELFFKLMSSMILFYGGGHSLYEFVAPFSLLSVQKEFQTTPGFNSINLETMFYSSNKVSFDEALQHTIDYNKRLTLRSHVRAQLTGDLPLEPKGTSNLALAKLELIHKTTHILDEISVVQKKYFGRSHHFFTSHSTVSKEILIQRKLENAKNFLTENNISMAKCELSALKEQISFLFGSHGFWGHPSKAYQLVLSLEEHLAALFDVEAHSTEYSIESSTDSGSHASTVKHSTNTDSAAFCVSRISSC